MNLPYPLLLASTSKYRGQLLSQLGWTFQSVAPGVDEDQFKNLGLSPAVLAQKLAQLKAEAVFSQRPDSCVIGSDQVCTMDGRIFGKPSTIENATAQLLFMQGKVHELITAVTVLYPGGTESFFNVTTLQMRTLSLEQIQAYINQESPLDCAGSYKLESSGIKLFESLQMSDHTSIIGLPLIELTSVLLKLGYPL